jgi:hypothetical protein
MPLPHVIRVSAMAASLAPRVQTLEERTKRGSAMKEKNENDYKRTLQGLWHTLHGFVLPLQFTQANPALASGLLQIWQDVCSVVSFWFCL